MISIFSKLKKNNRRKRISGAEIECITTELIDEVSIKLRKQFDAKLEEKLKSGEKLEIDFAKEIIEGLLNEAAVERNNLIARIEKDIETGDLFDRYYGKMQTINNLTNNAYAKMQHMNDVKEHYDYQRGVYKKITGKMYVPEALPDEVYSKKTKGENRRRDILEIMDEQKRIIEENE